MGKNNRQIRRENDRKYLYIVIGTLILVGGGLIGLVYGVQALATALPCLLGGAMAIFLPWLILTGLDRWRSQSEKGYLNQDAFNNDGQDMEA